jgi:hypothetical protein
MFRSALASLVLATLYANCSPAAHAKTCIRDLAGQIVCGELVETRDEPGDQADPRQDDSRDLTPEPPCEPGKVRVMIRGNSQCRYPGNAVPAHGGGYREHGYREYGYRDSGSYDAPNFGGNVVRPVRGRNGAISCSNPRYTWQDGACKPYRGP